MKSWSLYNREEKLRIDDLNIEQVKIILLSISARRIHEWYACQAGDLSWKPLAEVPEYFQETEEIRGEATAFRATAGDEKSFTKIAGDTKTLTRTKKPVPKGKAKEKSIKKVTTAPHNGMLDGANILTIHDLIVDKSQTQERRSARRYVRQLSFQVTRDQNTFVSQTVDISMNGLSLRNPLPPWVPRAFSATLKLNQYSIKIQCEKVDEQKLKIIAAESWDLIRQWIVNW